jgi:glycosyltransferase involved in cell wall biosynthesis
MKLGNAAVLPQLVQKLDGHDLVHLHYTFYGADVFVWLWSVLRRKPYVLTYHMQPNTSDWRNVIFQAHRWLIEPFILRAAKAVFVSSLDYAQSVDVKHAQLVDLPFGVDEERFFPGSDDAFRSEHDIPASATVFVFVGGLDKAHSFKGVDVLIRAAANLETQTDWRLLIVGDGDMRKAYTDLARAVGVGDKVLFLGALSDSELPRAYRAGNAHILPSVSKSEAFGLVTLEAAASGLPSIVSNLPGVRTLVEDRETGFIVEPGSEEALEEVMQKFLQNPQLAAAMGQKARARIIAGYTRKSLADRLAEVYNRITSQK